jgi:hypothetical protein
LGQYVEVGEAQAGVRVEIDVELAHERGLCLQQRTPRQFSAPARQRLLGKAAEESCYIARQGIYLHMQPVLGRVLAIASISHPYGGPLVAHVQPDLQDALRRIDEYVFPLEDARALAAYGVHSGVNKILIINREWTPERITVVLCDEALGF